MNPLLKSLAVSAAIVCAGPLVTAQAGSATETSAKSSQDDKKAALLDAKKALLENLILGKRDPSIGKRIQKGLQFRAFILEIGRLTKETGALDAELGKLAAVKGDAPSAEARKSAAMNLMKAMLGDVNAKAALLEDRASAKVVLAGYKKNLGAMRRMQVVNYTQNAGRSGARFIGQFVPLEALGSDVLNISMDLLEDPRGLDDRFRGLLVIGMRDFVKKFKLSKDQLDTLKDIAGDEFEDPTVARNVTALLAYAGHRELYDAQVKALNEKIAGAKGQDAVRHLSTLVDLQSVAENNVDAAKTYRKIVELFKNADDNVLGTHYYNLCCSLEKSGDRDAAFQALDVSLAKTGKRLAQGTLWIDRDIAKMRKDKRFDALLEKHGLEWPAAMRRAKDASSKTGSKNGGEKGDK